MAEKEKPKAAIFQELDAENVENEVTEVTSLCMSCYREGTTKLLLTLIPYFREVIISSFSCEECGHSDRSIQSGGRIQEEGIRYTVTVTRPEDLDRQVVKSDSATLSVPSVDLEQPPSNRKGEVTTLEGLFDSVIDGLMQDQQRRLEEHPEVAAQIEAFTKRLEDLKLVKKPFDMVLDDPSGNSFVENPNAPSPDLITTVIHYARTHEQNVQLGLESDDKDLPEEEKEVEDAPEDAPAENEPLEPEEEVLSFDTNCPNCNAPVKTNMKLTKIPFFKEVVIMATCCDACGLRENEVKGGSGISDKATRITLKITDPSDLNRDVLKSDTCAVSVPELELELVEGTLGGRFTTVEGLLDQIKTELEKKNPFFMGDSADTSLRGKMTDFLRRLDEVIQGDHLNVTLILDDPAGNSYVQNVYAPDDDPELLVEHYVRSEEQDALLGLDQMKTEDYEES